VKASNEPPPPPPLLMPPPPPLLMPPPVETTRLTAEPRTTSAPAAGLSLMTLPEATVVLDC